MAELSPAARAVLDAIEEVVSQPAFSLDEQPPSYLAIRLMAAAALSAVADQVVPETANAVGDSHDEARHDQWLRIRWKILAIAAELEG